MNGHVESHQFDKLWIIVSDHFAIIGWPIKGWINSWGWGSVTVKIVVNNSCNGWEVSNAIHAIFVNVFPVGGLVDTFIVSLKLVMSHIIWVITDQSIYLGELGLSVHKGNGSRELGHWVNIGWQWVQHIFNMSWETCTSCPFSWKSIHLLLGWDFTSHQKPEKGFFRSVQ